MVLKSTTNQMAATYFFSTNYHLELPSKDIWAN